MTITPDTLLLAFAAILAVALVGLVVLLFKSSGADYRPAEIMTGNEKEFFSRLCRALPGKHIFVQVSLAAIIQPTAARGSKRHLLHFRRISQKRADYVICNTAMEILAVVELDDRTHNVAQDMIRDSYLASAGIRTIRYESKNKPTREAIAYQFAELEAGRLP